MKARDAISGYQPLPAIIPEGRVDADTPVIEALPRLLDTADHQLAVMEEDRCIGVMTESSLLESLNRIIVPRDDSSLIIIETPHSAYSASHLAHAVEDADTHLVDLWSSPAEDGNVRVTLRVRSDDPSPVVMSLQRYGYLVTFATGKNYRDAELAAERLLELQALLNV